MTPPTEDMPKYPVAYDVKVSGCDDSTRFTIECRDASALDLLHTMVQRCNDASEYSCMPTMEVRRAGGVS